MKNLILSISVWCITCLSVSSWANTSYIEVNDIKYEVIIQGHGDNILIFESGFGTDASTWQPLVNELGKAYKTIAYSRVGTGKTTPNNKVMTIKQHVDQLQLLTEAMNINRSFTLIGHSYGGLVAIEYSKFYPNNVNALVLIDPAVRSQRTIFKNVAAEQIEKDDTLLRKYMPQHLVDDYQILIEQMDLSDAHVQPIAKSLPTILFTSTKVSEQPFVFEETAKGKEIWLSIHNQLFSQIEAGKHYQVNNVGHNIHSEDPKLISEAIKSLLNTIKTTSSITARESL